MPFTQVRDTRVAYEIDGQGPALVLVAGTGGNLQSNWGHLVEPLAARHTLVRVDYSGAGETTDPQDPLTVALLADQVQAAASAAGATRFDLAGFSLGAGVAMQLAATYPEQVRSLTLLAGFADGGDARLSLQCELWQELIRQDVHSFAKQVLLSGFSPSFLATLDRPQMNQWLDAIVTSNRWEGILRQIDLDGRLDLRAQLTHIRCPTLVIGCTQDTMVPPAHARALADGIAAAQYRTLDSGHLAPFEQPDAFVRMLLEFMDSAAR